MYLTRIIGNERYSVIDVDDNIYTEVACLKLDNDYGDGENILYVYTDIPSDKLKEIESSFRIHKYQIKRVDEQYIEKEVYLYKVDEVSFEYKERYNYVNQEIYYMISNKSKKSDIFIVRDLQDRIDFNLIKRKVYDSVFILSEFEKWIEKNK